MCSSIHTTRKGTRGTQIFYGNVHCDIMQKQFKCPSTGEHGSQTWSVHTVDYHSALKRKGALTHVRTGEPWRQAKCTEPVTRDKHWMSPLTEHVRLGQICRARTYRLEVPRGWGRGLAMGSFGATKKFWKSAVAMVGRHCVTDVNKL